MDPQSAPLEILVAELAASESFRAFAEGFPAPARISEPALPLVLASLHRTLQRPLLCLFAEDDHARDAAEAASWFTSPSNVALLPGRGVRLDSGLEPPAHLVGERARALDVLARGGLVCASARALADRLPPPGERPLPLRVSAGAERGLEELVEALTLSGYDRVERVEERGQIAVRGGLVDLFPSTGREPLRIEFLGDEVEQVRSFSPYTQRALSEVPEAVIYPASERLRDVLDPEVTATPELRGELDAGSYVPPVDRTPDVVWQPDDVRRVWSEEGLEGQPLEGAAQLDPFPRGQHHAFEAQRPAIAARGLAEAESELVGMVKQGRRVLVAFPHRGEALRTQRLLRKIEATLLEGGDALPREPGVAFVVSPARRGFIWRELGVALLPDVQVFRKRPPRADARLGRALQSFADLRTGDFVVHEDHGVGRLLGFETKEVAGVTRDYLYLAFKGDDRLYVPHEQLPKVSRYVGADARSRRSPTCARATSSSTRTTASGSCSGSRRRPSRGSRATTCSSRSAATTASTCRTSRSGRSPATSAPTATPRPSRSSAARRGTASRRGRGRASASWPET